MKAKWVRGKNVHRKKTTKAVVKGLNLLNNLGRWFKGLVVYYLWGGKGAILQNNDFVTSASYVLDTSESPKTHKSSWRASRRRQRSIDGSQDGFVENPVRVVSVAVLILVQVYVVFIKNNAIWKYFGNIN